MMRIWIGAGVLIATLAIAFGLYVLHTSEEPAAPPRGPAVPALALVSVKHSYSKGTHTVSGTVETPTPCTAVTANAALAADGSVRVDLSAAPDEGICLQLATTEPFSTTAEGPAGAPATFYVNGALATTTP